MFNTSFGTQYVKSEIARQWKQRNQYCPSARGQPRLPQKEAHILGFGKSTTSEELVTVEDASGVTSLEFTSGDDCVVKGADHGSFYQNQLTVDGEKDDHGLNPRSLTTVLASLNKMSILRQRTLVMKGNVTKQTPLQKFKPGEVSVEIERILATALKGVQYDPKRAGILVKSLSESIKGRVKMMKFPRYKFIVVVTITSQSDQSMVSGSKCLWNTSSDSYATAHYVNGSLAAVGTVYALLHE